MPHERVRSYVKEAVPFVSAPAGVPTWMFIYIFLAIDKDILI
jgi:hypothetical protein